MKESKTPKAVISKHKTSVTKYLHELFISEVRGRSRHKHNRNRVVRNLEERNVRTKGKSPKQGLISSKDLTIQLSLDASSFIMYVYMHDQGL